MKIARCAGLWLCGVLAAAMGCHSVDEAGLGSSPVNPERMPDAAPPRRAATDTRADAPVCAVPMSDCRAPDSHGPAVCVNLADDEENCGSCGQACPAGAACTMGRCACSSGATVCAGTCVDVKADARNCGACGRACAARQVCVAGTCLVTCQEGQTVCDGTCVNLRSDSDNCGTCGHDCKGKRECVAGECVRRPR